MDYITPGHVQAFQMVRAPHYENITLSSCRVNGEPGVAIIMMDYVGEDKVAVMPLFVAITKSMELELPGERQRHRGDDGGPTKPSAAFKVNGNEVTQPS